MVLAGCTTCQLAERCPANTRSKAGASHPVPPATSPTGAAGPSLHPTPPHPLPASMLPAHPQLLECGQRILEVVGRLAQHMRIPPLLHNVPVGLVCRRAHREGRRAGWAERAGPAIMHAARSSPEAPRPARAIAAARAAAAGANAGAAAAVPSLQATDTASKHKGGAGRRGSQRSMVTHMRPPPDAILASQPVACAAGAGAGEGQARSGQQRLFTCFCTAQRDAADTAPAPQQRPQAPTNPCHHHHHQAALPPPPLPCARHRRHPRCPWPLTASSFNTPSSSSTNLREEPSGTSRPSVRKCTLRQAGGRAGRQAGEWAGRQAGERAGRQAGGREGRQAGRRVGGHTGRQAAAACSSGSEAS